MEWHPIQAIMDAAVKRGLSRRGQGEITFAGMDEKAFRKGKKSDDFACVPTDLDESRVLEVGRGRTAESAVEVIDKALTPLQQQRVCAVATDMAAPYDKGFRERLVYADIVFDRFHIEKHLSDAVD